MDFFFNHWVAYPRRFPFPTPLWHSGYIPAKDHWIRRTFQTCNFSLVLKGRGEYHRKGKVWPVVAPCVLTQWPEDPVAYGPPLPEETWDELYLMYAPDRQEWFRERGFFREERPVWPISNLNRIWPLVEEFHTLSHTKPAETVVDLVDNLCDRIILETLTQSDTLAKAANEALHKIALRIQGNIRHNFDFNHLAGEYGMSPSTFRRRWAEVYQVPPWRYLLDLRIQKARHILVTSDQSVATIAETCGFEDMLYFSRRFKIETGLSPTQYRHQWCSPRRDNQ